MIRPIIHTFSIALPYSTHLLLFYFTISALYTTTYAAITQELVKGFKATPDPSITTFQPLLTDPTNNFSLSFLRVNQTQLTLSIIHVPSGEPLWQATTSGSLLSARWDKSTKLIFNGSLVISDTHSHIAGVYWSTNTNGDRVVISNTSNLLIINDNNNEGNHLAKSLSSPLWQSFHFPYDTLVQNQNFTSAMTLLSSNEQYTMRLGPDFIGLYAKFNENQNQMYFKHGALEAKADIVPGNGPIYIRVNSDGWLGMYQNETKPVDVEAFNSYQRSIPGILRLRLESDGNLKGYYWSGSSWELDYQAITSTCELPSPCGSYGLCKSGHGCSCLNNQTVAQSGDECYPGQSTGDFCNGSGDEYKVLRRTGLELPFKELMGYSKTSTLDECEEVCKKNCTCWGAVYNNVTGFCYTLGYPIQTLVDVEDDSKVGYFKVREGVGKKKMDVGLGVGIGLLSVALLLLCGAAGFGVYKLWNRKRKVKGYLKEDDLGGAVPYKDLGSSSFGSIELNSNNR